MALPQSVIDSDSYKEFFEFVTERDETILLSNEALQNHFGSERILITGAGGSIGSALAKRLTSAKIPNLFFLDRDESGLHALSLNLADISAAHSDKFLIADIRDRYSIKNSILMTKPTIVIHAAALKHLVMLERFPREGYLTNVLGTLNVAEICIELGVEQFINISTDKAANPVSILGKTKKLAELITEESYAQTILNQCSVRFGNVFASRGSVIETFIHQITHGIPVTVTDPNVRRFFMSQNEAANLVLAAASLKEGGTYIQNMGAEVKITDLVSRIADYLKLPYSINLIGLQKGEKMQEELYDGPVNATQYAAISKSIHSITVGLVKSVKTEFSESNNQALDSINSLVNRFTK
jgi:FlaA1/EpsC-like NDP-sugar epimerase